jgi:hypothetical protein
MVACKPKNELDFLKRVDAAYRQGLTQSEIAQAEGLVGGGPSLLNKVARLGFRFARRGGLMLVDGVAGRPLTEWIESGDLRAASEAAGVAA